MIAAFPAEGQPCCEPEAFVVVSLHTRLRIRKGHSWILEGDDLYESCRV